MAECGLDKKQGGSDMRVVRLFSSPQSGQPLLARRRLELALGQGVVGDRHCGRRDWPGQIVTLVEAEEIERFCQYTGRLVDLGLSRRNIVTRGVRLNDLVGQRFSIGNTLLYGVERCEPCNTLGKLLATEDFPGAEVIRYWMGRGGLRADVLRAGEVTVGDTIDLMESSGIYA